MLSDIYEAYYGFLETRCYQGVWYVVAYFLITCALAFGPLRRAFRLAWRKDWLAICMLFLATWTLALYAGVKPPPTPPPPGPKGYARLYARPEYGGAVTNDARVFRPVGKGPALEPPE